MRNPIELDAQLDTVVEFNELYGEYTRDIRELLVEIGLARPDITVLRKLGRSKEGTTSAWLRFALDMDAGQLSRSLRMLEAHGCVSLAREAPDARYLQVRLTPEGSRTLGVVDRYARNVAMRMMGRFPEEERAVLVAVMGTLSGILRHRRLWPSKEHALVPFQVPRLRRAD